jgi:hypothetical protein
MNIQTRICVGFVVCALVCSAANAPVGVAVIERAPGRVSVQVTNNAPQPLTGILVRVQHFKAGHLKVQGFEFVDSVTNPGHDHLLMPGATIVIPVLAPTASDHQSAYTLDAVLMADGTAAGADSAISILRGRRTSIVAEMLKLDTLLTSVASGQQSVQGALVEIHARKLAAGGASTFERRAIAAAPAAVWDNLALQLSHLPACTGTCEAVAVEQVRNNLRSWAQLVGASPGQTAQ